MARVRSRARASRARGWVTCRSSSIVGTPSLTKRAKSDWSSFEYFANDMLFTTGGSWWWSPIRTMRLSRERFVAASSFCSTIGMKVSTSMICAASSITSVSYWKPRESISRRLMAACVHVIAIT